MSDEPEYTAVLIFSDDEQFIIDAVETLAPSYTQQVTQNFVEQGVDITDHSRPTPITLSLTGFMGDAPMITQADEPTIWDPNAEGPHLLLDYRLEQAATTGEQITIDCGNFGTFERMIITNYAPVRDAQHGQSLPFTLSLQQVLTATTETINLDKKQAAAGVTPEQAGPGVNPRTEQNIGMPSLAADPETKRFADPAKRGLVPNRAPSEAVDLAASDAMFAGENLIDINAPAFAEVLA